MNNIIQTIRHTARAATVLLLSVLTTMTAWANDAVTYIDENGVTQTVTDYYALTGSETPDGNGRVVLIQDVVVVNSNVTYDQKGLNLNARSGNEIKLILCDGCTLTINSNSNDFRQVVVSKTLTIYGQTNNSGKLVVNASNQTAIHAGDMDKHVTVTVNGGTVESTSTHNYGRGLTCSALVFNGGNLKLEGNVGVQCHSNTAQTVTLNWRSASDRVYISSFSYVNTVNIGGAGGKCFTDGNGNYYGGTYTSGFSAFSGKELQPATARTLVLPDGVTATGALFTDSGVDYYAPGSTVTLSDLPAASAGYLDWQYTVNGTPIDGTSFTMPADANATVALTHQPDPTDFELTATDEYTIHTADGWGVFCDALQDNDTYNRFSGKTVKLGANISVTRMAGASGKDFTGTFDGQGNTLTVNYANTDNNVMTAPFSYVDGATIRNLIVDGSITGSAYRAAGIIGETGNTTSHITNCVSSVTISGDRYTGGFSIGGNVAIEGCVFNGKINATSRSGGFIGHSNSAQVIKNSLFAPKDGSSISGGTFYYNGGGDVDPVNSYYTRALGTAQGKALHSVTAGDDVTLALSGTATEYTVSGITAYEGNQGIKYGTTYYAGSGDAVSLTLSNTATGAPEGYKYGYTASAGTLIGSTLTMPAEDVTISVNTAVLTAIPWDGDGTEGSPYIIKYASQLDLLAYRVNGTHGEALQTNGYYNTYFKLDNDISYTHTSDWDAFDSDESNFEAIGGYYYDDDRSFSGHFDGNNKTISGIRIHKDGIGNANMFQGIFGLTGSGADIHDLTLANARITGYDYTGGIVGYNDGATVTHCHVAGDVAVCAVQSYAHYHGGIAGNNDGTIEQCTSAANLTIAGATSAYYGGIAGINQGTLSDNLAIGATVPAAAYNTYGAITGSNGGTLQRNYYANCKVANTENATGVGCGDISDGNGGYIVADVNNDNNPDGAVSINTLALTANQAPDGNYWTTYYNGALGFTIDDDEHACAYTATYGAGQLTLHKLGKEIPAGTAVIIVADNSVVSMTAATALDDISGTNDLHGVDYDTDVDDITSDLGTGTFYVLGMTTVDNEKHFGFHRYTGEEMAAHKAFVLVDSQSAARSLTMVFDEATGISDATRLNNKEEIKNNNWFTLDGRRLQAKPTAPGIYVNNGRKVVIK